MVHAPHDWKSSSFAASWVAERSTKDHLRATHFGLMAKLMPFRRDETLTLLDIGAGYGPLTKVLLDTFPNATVIAQDFSEAMLEHAAHRLTSYENRVRFVKSDLLIDAWTTDIGAIDAAVSSMCLHELGAPQRARSIYQEVFTLLRPGGAFMDVDIVNGADPATHWLYTKGLFDGVETTPDDPAGTRALIAGNYQPRAHYPFPATVDEKRVWLNQSGFVAADCWWKEMGRALVGGFKSLQTNS